MDPRIAEPPLLDYAWLPSIAPPRRMQKTLEDLEWNRLTKSVQSRCVGRSRNEPLPLADGPEATARTLAESKEAWTLLVAGEPLPLDGLREVDEHLLRLGRQGVLDAAALRDLMLTIGHAGQLRRFLGARRNECPNLQVACSSDPTLDGLGEELSSALTPEGKLADNASPELRRLRTETANLRGRLIARLEALIQKRGELLSDRFYTQRDGRYVIPVRADAHERVSGIVHGTSQSGATIFVEPRELIAQGNRLRLAQGEMEREENRILALLSDRVRERLAELTAAVAALAHADLKSATARLARDLDARFVELSTEPAIELREARHPLLVLDGVDVVATSLTVAAGQALVISGPNAGGKTVALKLLGLSVLCQRAGLPFPCAEGTRSGYFDAVLTDVGDDQSMQKNLSTFSAHIKNVADILSRADEQALVLLDEVATGTDPGEGAALACAVVDSLCRRGSAVAVTTHYEPLKAFALRDDRLTNASVGFDSEKFLPTFEIHPGVPGSSSALYVARRFGLPSEVIDFAETALPEQSRTFDDLVRKLEAQRSELAAAAADLRREQEALEAEKTRLDQRAEALEARDRRKVGQEAERLLDQIRRARDELRAAKKELRRKDRTAEALKRSEARIAQAVETVQAAGPAEPVDEPSRPPIEGTVSPGDRVFVPHLRVEAAVLEVLDDDRLRVAAGNLKVTVKRSEVAKPLQDETRKEGATVKESA
ncbi:MAG: MutS2/Smr-associated SH3 domain-containing protein, partial [Myxococcota bacterium]